MSQAHQGRAGPASPRSDDAPGAAWAEGPRTPQGGDMTDELEEMGPIDYIVLEWPGDQPKGEVAPLILDLHDRGIIRILDIALMVKGDDGSVAAIDLGGADGDSGGGSGVGGGPWGRLRRQGARGGGRAAE